MRGFFFTCNNKKYFNIYNKTNAMADFNLLIRERFFIDSEPRGGDYNLTIKNVTHSDNRVLNIPSGSEVELFNLSDTVGPGTFVTSSLKYARITNLSVSHSINLRVSSSNENINFDVVPGGSFLLSSAQITGSVEGGANPLLGYDNIASIKCEPSSSDCRVEYFLVTS